MNIINIVGTKQKATGSVYCLYNVSRKLLASSEVLCWCVYVAIKLLAAAPQAAATFHAWQPLTAVRPTETRKAPVTSTVGHSAHLMLKSQCSELCKRLLGHLSF